MKITIDKEGNKKITKSAVREKAEGAVKKTVDKIKEAVSSKK